MKRERGFGTHRENVLQHCFFSSETISSRSFLDPNVLSKAISERRAGIKRPRSSSTPQESVDPKKDRTFRTEVNLVASSPVEPVFKTPIYKDLEK